jgi:hypothetical protein
VSFLQSRNPFQVAEFGRLKDPGKIGDAFANQFADVDKVYAVFLSDVFGDGRKRPLGHANINMIRILLACQCHGRRQVFQVIVGADKKCFPRFVNAGQIV